MRPLAITGRLLDRLLRRYTWYLKLIDELSGTNAQEEFRQKWLRQLCDFHSNGRLVVCTCEPIPALAVRHDMIIRRLEHDIAERRVSLPGIFQVASVTLAALSIAGVGLALVSGKVAIDTPIAKLALLVTIVLFWLLIGSYMPKWVKGRVPFMDAGVYTVRYGVVASSGDGEAYYGELAKLSYAESLVYDLNVRNRVLQKNRRRLGNAHLIIRGVLMVAALAVLRLLVGM